MADSAAAPPLFIVLNTASGHAEAQQQIDTIVSMLRAANREHELLQVEEPARLAETARSAVALAKRRHGIVVAAGGDGTVNATAQAVVGSGCTFGVIPQGTFNYVGRTHGIPSDTSGAIQVLLTGRTKAVQVGAVNGRVFLVNASLGLYPQLLEDREAFKRQFGRSRLVAFGAGLLTLLREHRTLRLGLERDGTATVHTTPTLFVGNNRLQLEQIGLPQADAVDRGQLAAILLRPVGVFAMLVLLVRGAMSRLGEAEDVLSFGFERMTVTPRWRYGRRRIKVATDGEVVWMRAPLEFSVKVGALTLLVPASRPQDDPA